MALDDEQVWAAVDAHTCQAPNDKVALSALRRRTMPDADYWQFFHAVRRGADGKNCTVRRIGGRWYLFGRFLLSPVADKGSEP